MNRHDISIPAGTIESEPVMIDAETSCEIVVKVGKNASVCVVCVQTSQATTPVTIVQRGTVASGGSLHWFNVTLGTDVTQDLRSECTGDNATSTVDWIFLGQKTSKQTLSARNIFSASNGAGEITMKGVAEGKAYAKAEGMIEITERGRGTNAYLTQDVLMLDPTAKIDAIPALDIRTNDVKASHSATVSRVTPEDLFYFQSRGIDVALARQMYIAGFIGSLVERLTSEEARRTVRESLHI